MDSTEGSAIFANHLRSHQAVIAELEAMGEQISLIGNVWISALQSGKKILFLGNGGSAADAQHLAAELVVRYRNNRKALAGIALTTDSSVLTAHGNDFGFDTVFARQIEALAVPGDVVVGISTSGTSKNVVAGLTAALDRGCITIAMTGQSGGLCNELADHCLKIPSNITAHIQECHILVGHVWCEMVEQDLTE